MKYSKYGFVLAICLVIVNPIGYSSGKELSLLSDGVVPLASMGLTLLAIPPPLGPILSTGLSMLHLFASTIISNSGSPKGATTEEVDKAISKVDLLHTQTLLQNAIKDVDSHVLEESDRIIRELTYTVTSHEFFEKVRNTLEYLRGMYEHNIKIILNSKVTGLQKNLTMNDMQNYDSRYRKKLRMFVNDFIKPNHYFNPNSKPIKLFFEKLLENESLLAINEEDYHSDSAHTAVFKSFVYIAKILTECYVMAVAAHFIQYQQEIRSGSYSDAEGSKGVSAELIMQYKTDMKALIEKTKWALDNSSRDIRNSGSFELIEGVTFEHVTFASILPKIWDVVDRGYFDFYCQEVDGLSKLNDYELGVCDGHFDDLPIGTRLTIVGNPLDWKKPYSYMNITTKDMEEIVFGHKKGHSLSTKIETRTFEECYTVFCPAFKKKAFAISTNRVNAQPGNVITGLRLRVKQNVLYIDIQEGKFIDSITVDPATVVWTESPESGKVEYLNLNLRKFEMGNFEVQNNTFLTSIQLKKAFLRKGLIKVFVAGSNAPEWNEGGLISFEDKNLELNELILPEADDPTRAEVGSKKLISKAPVADKPYFVKFQPSGFKKDFGRSTVPLLDIREVVSNPPAPLGGFGFYHEAVPGTGGLIAVKLIVPRLSDLIDFNIIEEFAEKSLNVS